MDPKRLGSIGAATLAVIGAAVIIQMPSHTLVAQQAQKLKVPKFEWDPTWPKLPADKTLGMIGGIYADSEDHVWVTHRPASLPSYERSYLQRTECCAPLPPVSEFDGATGRFIGGFGPVADVAPAPRRGGGGGDDEGGAGSVEGVSQPADRPAHWPLYEHGAYVDYKGNFWLCGNGDGDNQCDKFTRDGKFLLQIGEQHQAKGNTDTHNLNQPTKVAVWPQTNEVFIADGYVNRRVIVFDADTGAFKRMWGAYGNAPTDPPNPLTRRGRKREDTGSGKGPDQFNLVHSLAISKDGIVYVADRMNNRVQTFTIEGKYLNEVFEPIRNELGNGGAFDIAFSPDAAQTYMYVANNSNGKIEIFERKTLKHLGNFGRMGHQGGAWDRVHSITVDSKGNIYTGETGGHRVQKFTFKGLE